MKLSDPMSYYVVESFCKECGRTVIQYVDFDGENIIYKEDWFTDTGWYHKSDRTFLCKDIYIHNDEDFLLRFFKISLIPDLIKKEEELFV